MSSTNKIVVGIMSGTSLDGTDVSLMEVSGYEKTLKYKLLAYASYPYSTDLKEKILAVSKVETSDVAAIATLHYELGTIYSDAVRKLLTENNWNSKIDLIGLHGQTIHHLPNQEVKATMQIGNASQLAYDFETTVVSNFREMDIVAGGDGAPLVPYTDYLMFQSDEEGILLQNIGGIGNVTILPAGCTLDDVSAYDTGPGNMMINAAMKYYYNQEFDQDGRIAATGVVIDELMTELLKHPYLQEVPPKSTGREMFGEEVVVEVCKRYPNRAEDVIRTLTEYAAETIAKSYRDYIFTKTEIRKVIVSGGGAYNPVLMQSLTERLDIQVLTQEDLGFSSDAKEAIAFGLLANETMNGICSNVLSATGARERVVLGQVTFNPKR